MIRRLLNKIFSGNDIALPPEYDPWLEDIVPLMGHCLSNVKRKEINKDSNGNLRILINLFLLGIVDFYRDKKELTFGQHRYLYIAAGQKLGMTYDALSVASDSRDNLQIIAPDLILLATDALDAGYRAGREYFNSGDTRGNYLLDIKLKQWSDQSYQPPKQPSKSV
jgi:hypothetical protein